MERCPHCQAALGPDASRGETHGEPVAEAGFRELFQTNQAVMLVVDPASGRIREANPAACAFYGIDQQALTGMNIADINMLSPDEIRQRMDAVTQKRESRFVMPHRLASGETRTVEVFSNPVHIGGRALLFSIIQDVTERLTAEAARQEADAMLRSVFDSSPDLLLLMDRDLRIRLSNWKGRDFVPPEVRDTHPHCYQVFMNRTTPCEPCLALEVFRTGQPCIYERFNPNPAVGHIEVHAYPIGNAQGEVVMVAEHVRNINNRKRAEREKAELQARLHQAQKMESIGTLAGGLAHDFNNLLMAILGNVSLMQDEVGSDEALGKGLRHIEAYVRSAADLTRQLLGFAQGGKYVVQATDLNAVLARSTAMFGRTRKDIRITTDLAPQLATVEVDRGQIEQVLLNIFVNAGQAMPTGGELIVATGNVTLDEAYTRPYGLPAGPYVRTAVTDTGTGMDEKIRERIFDPFFTTKGLGKGSGLGLASAYGIVRNHGGIINVYSEPGHGSTFTIYLPASSKPAAAAAAPGESAPAALSGRTILLVDDEMIILDTAARMLTRLGATVLRAASGPEALEIFQARKGAVDLVILDMIMPGMGGGETFDRLRVLDDAVPVILASGYSINGQAAGIMARGCNGFIQKPFTLAELTRRIHEVLGND